MTLTTILFIAGAVLLLAVVAWLLVRPLAAESALGPVVTSELEALSARHCRHLTQMRQALATDDRAFIDRRLPASAAKRVQLERRKVLRKYLSAIGEDFARLDNLARVVASHSPEIVHAQEAERLWLELRFRLLYRTSVVRLWAGGSLEITALTQLADIVAGRARELEALMTWMQTPAAERAMRGASGV